VDSKACVVHLHAIYRIKWKEKKKKEEEDYSWPSNVVSSTAQRRSQARLNGHQIESVADADRTPASLPACLVGSPLAYTGPRRRSRL